MPHDEHLRYLGVLGLLCECAVYVTADLRDMIEQAMEDACAADPLLRWRRILNRIEIESARGDFGAPAVGGAGPAAQSAGLGGERGPSANSPGSPSRAARLRNDDERRRWR